jgi:ABC-type nitrate/sulfonate/bicarbonate transport system permease component
VFLLLWEFAPQLGLSERYFPSIEQVFTALAAYSGQASFWADVSQTLLQWGIGLAVSIVAGAVIGMLIGLSDFLRKATYSTIEFLRPVPSVALIPLAILVFGDKIGSALLLVIYAAFWQVLLQVLYGVNDVDPVAESTAKSYGLGRLARVRYVVWPTVLPYLMTGVRLGSAVALILAITAELVIGNPGLGLQIALTQSGGAIAKMYALIVMTGILGVVINLGVRMLERRLLSWHASVRSEVHA